MAVIIKINKGQYKYLLVRRTSLVARAPNSRTETKYIKVVVRVAASVPTGMDLCVSFRDADRFDPAMIPVTAGKNSPTNAL